MNANTKKLYDQAITDSLFQHELIQNQMNCTLPDKTWTEFDKHIYASVYLGWLVGKKLYNPENYK